MKRLAFHWQILIGMAAGILFGFVAAKGGWGQFVTHWIKPFGIIFVNSLKLIAVPLVIASLMKGIADLKDITRLSSLGGRTISYFLITTIVAASLGLLVVNTLRPGDGISPQTRTQLAEKYKSETESRIQSAGEQQQMGPLQPLIDVVPDNIFAAATSNRNMLQLIFFTLFFSIGLILIPAETAQPIKVFIDGVNAVIMKLVELIMLTAPLGVFALLAALVVDTTSWEIFRALLWYCLSVLIALGVMLFLFYPLVVRIFTGRDIAGFIKGMAPVQLLAFSTSSSAATLPFTLEQVEGYFGVEKEVSKFVLPIGTTINMDGTSIHQAISAVFIAQAFGLDLDLAQQLTIVATATLVSIGAPAIPSAGLVMLVIVLESAGIPQAGLALVFAVDRILDMSRTMVNVTGDATVAMLVGKTR